MRATHLSEISDSLLQLPKKWGKNKKSFVCNMSCYAILISYGWVTCVAVTNKAENQTQPTKQRLLNNKSTKWATLLQIVVMIMITIKCKQSHLDSRNVKFNKYFLSVFHFIGEKKKSFHKSFSTSQKRAHAIDSNKNRKWQPTNKTTNKRQLVFFIAIQCLLRAMFALYKMQLFNLV